MADNPQVMLKLDNELELGAFQILMLVLHNLHFSIYRYRDRKKEEQEQVIVHDVHMLYCGTQNFT